MFVYTPLRTTLFGGIQEIRNHVAIMENGENDAVGNLTKDANGYNYQYDYENRIVKITKDGNDIAQFAYDALGRRIRKTDSQDPNNTRFYYVSN